MVRMCTETRDSCEKSPGRKKPTQQQWACFMQDLKGKFFASWVSWQCFYSPSPHHSLSLCGSCSVHCCPLSTSSVCSCLADGGEIPLLRQRYLRHKLFADCHMYDIICEKPGEAFKWQITGVAKDAI